MTGGSAVFATGIRQFRMTLAMASGRRISPKVIDGLVSDAVATIDEFGAAGRDVEQLLTGLFADPTEHVRLQTAALQRTARYLAKNSPFYQDQFTKIGVDPKSVTVGTISGLPVTTRHDLVQRGREFICSGAKPYLATRTTGANGPSAEVWLSHYEAELWSALTVLSALLRGEFEPADRLQLNISSHATDVIHQSMRMCALTGATIKALGLTRPDVALDGLVTSQPGDITPTVLHTYPSYLAELVLAAERRGCGPSDFALRRIVTSGEILSPALASAACAIFGVSRIESPYGMTTILPVAGRDCTKGHLHFDLNAGFCEVLTVDDHAPCAAGELGTLVVTPYYPYRDCMPVFRYDTRDLVRSISADLTDCELAKVPAFSPILGKADDVLRSGTGMVTTRDIVEVLEALPSKPWPARFKADVVRDVVQLTVPASVMNGLTTVEVESFFNERHLDVHVRAEELDTGQAKALRRLRADLQEYTFARTAI